MTREEAKAIFAAWRPGMSEADDPALAEALALATHDATLAAWLDQHREFQAHTRAALRAIPVPPDLADRILAAHKVVRPEFHARGIRWIAAAAAVVLVLAFAAVLSLRGTADEETTFPTFRGRMVRSVIREYRMDVATNDLAAIRRFMARNQAPAEFELRGGLSALPPMGGGLLSWRGERVAMVCLDGHRQGVGTAFLFIVPHHLVTEGAPGELELDLEKVSRLATASWTLGDQTYVLAAAGSLDDVRGLVSPGGGP